LEQGNGLKNSLNDLRNNPNLNQTELSTINNCYTTYYDRVREYSSQFIYVIGAGSIFALYSQFISLLVIAEGKKWVVVYAAIFGSGINILIDYLLIQFAHLTMVSGAIAIVFGWFINTVICFCYI
jgi:Na+-driven multidrug efflux pump